MHLIAFFLKILSPNGSDSKIMCKKDDEKHGLLLCAVFLIEETEVLNKAGRSIFLQQNLLKIIGHYFEVFPAIEKNGKIVGQLQTPIAIKKN